MNQKTTYEIIIAEKLGQLTVPDLREAIWSRIEQQLDLDLPTDDSTPPDTPDGPRWISFTKRFGTFIVIAAITAVFFIARKNNHTSLQPSHTPAAIEQIIPVENQSESPPGTATGNTPPAGKNPAPITPGSGGDSLFTGINNAAPALPAADSIQAGPLPSSPVTTEKTTTPVQSNVAPATPKADSLPQKKPRGFRGITDDDYKINLRKDSLKGG